MSQPPAAPPPLSPPVERKGAVYQRARRARLKEAAAWMEMAGWSEDLTIPTLNQGISFLLSLFILDLRALRRHFLLPLHSTHPRILFFAIAIARTSSKPSFAFTSVDEPLH